MEVANPNCYCMKNVMCFKTFPKKLKNEVVLVSNGFVTCKWRDNNDFYVVKDGVKLDNKFVLPYNHKLLGRYQAYINIESCSQSILIKYLFIYDNKGLIELELLLRKRKLIKLMFILIVDTCLHMRQYEDYSNSIFILENLKLINYLFIYPYNRIFFLWQCS